MKRETVGLSEFSPCGKPAGCEIFRRFLSWLRLLHVRAKTKLPTSHGFETRYPLNNYTLSFGGGETPSELSSSSLLPHAGRSLPRPGSDLKVSGLSTLSITTA